MFVFGSKSCTCDWYESYVIVCECRRAILSPPSVPSPGLERGSTCVTIISEEGIGLSSRDGEIRRAPMVDWMQLVRFAWPFICRGDSHGELFQKEAFQDTNQNLRYYHVMG